MAEPVQYSVKQTAELLAISERTCWKLIKSNELKPLKIPGCRRVIVSQDSINKFQKKCEQ